jgi:citrate/tricarballylate utilization protein
MPSTDLLKEAERVLIICNACRYCEGYCAVFPAVELRRAFSDQDLKYFSNLCHNCRDCYYACQYAPPHEFALNVPKALAELRLKTYQEFTPPGFLARLFQRNGLWVAMITMAAVVFALLGTLFFQDSAVVFGVHRGAGAFYRVIPYWPIVISFSAIGLCIVTALVTGMVRFWRQTGGKLCEMLDLRSNRRAVWDVMRLKYLDGGGYGCNYPDDRFSMVRRWFHHLVFYGFICCFASTTFAFIYDHFFNLEAPYPFVSWPVILGSIGGAALLIGTSSLLYLKTKMDSAPATTRAYGMDVGFLFLLFLTSFTGFLLLFLRETSAMGILLAIHLGFVLGLFITMPYGKFIHAIYRYAALVGNAIEQSNKKN